ncbi:glycosyltransferase [Cellulomonas wangleii]|uniref:glycosyltransferase n=1 Tax=Cellulomonas wangleii TaxID=2816956 RepID=UPI0020C0CD93|nr:glycosyltransferase [Cellulomonas wangleii]
MAGVALVVVGYGSAALLEQHLVPSAPGADLVVVVDNRTDDDERRRVTDLADREGWATVLPDRNLGFGAGADAGAAEAFAWGADVVVLLNPDARLAPADRRVLVDAVRERPLLLAAPRVERPDGTPWMTGVLALDLRTGRMRTAAERRADPAPPWAVPWVSGACLAVTRELWERTGGFAHDYFLYWEDVDLSRRVLAVGGAVAVVPRALAVHDEGSTHPDRVAGRAKSATYYYYNVRNRMVFARAWLPREDRLRWHLLALPAARAVVLQGGRRQLLRPAPWVAAARGLLDGARGRTGDPRAGRGEERGRPVRVLPSFGVPRPTTNPYIVMLAAALDAQDGVDLRRFTWRTALAGRYDVVHLHWPESLFAARSGTRRTLKRWAFLAWTVRLAVLRTPVVRTVHNVEHPRDVSRLESLGLRAVDRLTTARVVLNDVDAQVRTRVPTACVLHGHYRDWYAPHPRHDARPGSIAFVGLVRRYKGVEGLLAAFTETAREGPDLTLTIAGRPSSEALADAVRGAAARDPRVRARLGFLDDAALVQAVTSAQVVVLPYRHMHNSGAVLAALSLDRPVLVPDTAVNRALADEVGPGWVLTYDDELTGGDLLKAVAATRDRAPGARPDLSRRGWQEAGRAHLAVYRAALGRGRT